MNNLACFVVSNMTTFYVFNLVIKLGLVFQMSYSLFISFFLAIHPIAFGQIIRL